MGVFQSKWWPLAAKEFVFAKNIRRTVDANYVTHPSPWEKRHKAGRFKGKEVPFGAAINFLPPKPLRKKSPKSGTSVFPGIFLGYHLSPGGRWRGEYLVSSIDSFRRFGTDRRKVPYYCVKEIYFDTNKPVEFPLSAEYQKSLWSIPTTAGRARSGSRARWGLSRRSTGGATGRRTYGPGRGVRGPTPGA